MRALTHVVGPDGRVQPREVHSRWGIPLADVFIARNLHPASLADRRRLHTAARGGRESAADAATLEPERGSSD